ncbi:Gfo/Idh/MocA family oxidoreductase [Photobacterium sp. BZF1]|uniref:Gfo/Idh/MocA family protein n=1 Tax=Photobacterium sp. BZF1 TaxID=1904457 RepID=UPI0016539CAB|nr:Gfo/Idh/MocA family oxidoreductase [Photobacterium sp. BZF1]MBC7003107.1 Gfo/Idh/MocA family oxidoreductase [Photobacterium sp. BZF1]
MEPLRIGLIGCGVISDIYLKTCQKFDIVDIVACASLDLSESKAKAEKYNIAKFCTPDEVINDPSIDAVLNLTIPAVHGDISLAAVKAGKHVYSEKPFVTDLEQGKEILAVAKQNNVLVGNAPDTFLGSRIQTCKKLLDDGIIGEPIGATAFVGTHGVERHHPNPDFYYKPGGGPLFDLGPYYLTALISLLGPIKQCAGMAKKSFNHRLIESQPRAGELIDVEVDTHISSLLEFKSGVSAMMLTSFDIWDSELPRLEIYGTKGTICIADPDPTDGTNIFGGDVLYRTRDNARWNYRPRQQGLDNWTVAKNQHNFSKDSRGLGLIDLAYAARDQRPVRASGEMALHVCEVMEGIMLSAKTGHHQQLTTECAIPAALPVNFPDSETVVHSAEQQTDAVL